MEYPWEQAGVFLEGKLTVEFVDNEEMTNKWFFWAYATNDPDNRIWRSAGKSREEAIGRFIMEYPDKIHFLES